jgi:hypothetical protein
MKRLDEDKVSWVEFIRSIKFAQQNASNRTDACPTHFAHFNPRARSEHKLSTEDSHLIRSAN